MMNNAEKIESEVKDKSKESQQTKKKGFPWIRLGCVGFIVIVILTILSICSFLWFGGYVKNYTCDSVQEGSEIWNNFNCGVQTTQEGEGEYKYNVLDSDNLTVSDIEVVVSNVVEKASPAVVAIGIEADEFSESQVIGSGFVVTENGLIVTNQHVVSQTGVNYFVVINGGEDRVEVTNIYRDEVNDIAVIKIDQSGLETLPLGDSDSIKVGQTAIAIGNPLGSFEGTVTTGIVSGLNRDVEVGSGFFNTNLNTFEGVIQTDAAINPGNSGGPLLNSSGEVIGVNFATISGADGLSFALPINRIKGRIDELNKYGSFRIPFLGVEYRQRTVFYDEKVLVGAVVSTVLKDGPADKFGLKVNDVIVEFDGQTLDGVNLASLIQTSEIGKDIEVRVIRDGKIRTLTIQLGDRAEFGKN